MKRIRVIVLTAFSALLPLLGLNATPTFTINGDTLTAVELHGDTEVVIPYGVTRIRNEAFRYCNGLKSVTIGGSVEEIESGAFQGCYALESVTIGGAIVTIGNDAFANCNNLESVTISSSADSWRTPRIGDYAFQGCNSLKSLTIGGNMAEIGNDAFQRCDTLESLTLSAAITKIGRDAFGGCSRLKSVTIGGSPTSGNVQALRIEDGAFQLCRELEHVTIGGNVELLGTSAFLSCGRLQNVTVGGYVREIGAQAFGECFKLKSVTVGGGVEYIGLDAFAACLELANLSLGGSLRSIDSRAFRLCRSLAEITIPASTTYIAGDAFLYCTGLETISVAEDNPAYMAQNGFLLSKDGGTLVASANDNIADTPERVTEIGASVFAGRTDLTSATIPDSVTRIGVSAFSGCSNLTNVVIPASVTYIGEKAFFGCNGLADEDGFVIVRSVLYDYFGDSGDIVIPDSVTSIGDNAFFRCSGLTSVTIPNSVTNIGYYAFCECSGLTNVTFLGNAPMMCDDVFLGISSCTASVSPKSTGWCVGAGEDWNGLTLQYWPEILTELASDAEVVEVMDKFADRRLAVQVTDKAEYDVFRAWVNGNNLYQPNVVESTRTWLSFALGANALIGKEITSNDVRIVAFEAADVGSGAMGSSRPTFAFEVAIDNVNIGGGMVAVETLKENLKKVLGIEGAARLEESAFSSENVDFEIGTPKDGKATFTAKPKDAAKGDSGTFFMRVRVNQ